MEASESRDEANDPMDAKELVVGGAYYAMSPTKLAVLSFVSFGLYDFLYWFRQWNARAEAGEDVYVVARSILSQWFTFPFVATLRHRLAVAARPSPTLLAVAPALYCAAEAADYVARRYVQESVLALGLGLLFAACRAGALAVIQGAVNGVLAADGYTGPIDRAWSVRTLLFAVIACATGIAMTWALND
ncbi:MAG: hypothetical protein RL385_2429 [Pseudomonadota bacterium]|jgi:hypothetical protein